MQKYGMLFCLYRRAILEIYRPFIKFGQTDIKYKKWHFSVDVADTFMKRRTGLSFRKEIGGDEGMLLAYPRAERRRIWMFNMRINVDILWLDKNGVLLYIVHNAKKAQSFNEFEAYRPNVEPKFVLELHEGAAKKYGMHRGERISLPRIEIID